MAERRPRSSSRPSDGRSSSGSSRGGSGRGPSRGDGANGNGGERTRPPRPRRSDSNRTGRSPEGKKIPPPPVIRDEVRIERVQDDPAPSKPNKRKKRSAVDVSAVEFGGVAPATATKMRNRLKEAAVAFQNDRFAEADKLLQSIQRLAPGVAEVHELHGLTYYRLGRWQKAFDELQTFAQMTGSVEQNPVMADCMRAMRRWSAAEELWNELGAASPSAELVEEGRIVQAGMLADRDRLDDAIRLLEKAPKVPRRPGAHHLRRWYMLADLYERSGDVPRARRTFGSIVEANSDFGDAADRLSALA